MQIYEVQTEEDERHRSFITLGYAKGDPKDIRDFYEDQREVMIDLYKVDTNQVQPIDVINITPQLVKQKYQLKEDIENLELRLEKAQDQLDNIGRNTILELVENKSA
ncbi:hypothetical protein ACFL1H_07185 [Nanoarchaeota archaeon]